MTQRSWEDLADGASLEDVVSLPDQRKTEPEIVIAPTRASSFHGKKRFNLFGLRKESTKAPNNAKIKKLQNVKSDKELTKNDLTSSADVGIRQGPTASTSVEDPADELPNNISVMTDDSCMRPGHGEPDAVYSSHR
jgi:hypothetical protein